MAPGDIVGGSEYSEVIPIAIKPSKLMVVVFSEAASLSQWVKSEIRIAFENNIPILPFRIDNTVPVGQMEIFLQGRHWIDAISNPESSLDKPGGTPVDCLNVREKEEAFGKPDRTAITSCFISGRARTRRAYPVCRN